MSHDLSQESLDDLLLLWSEGKRSVDVLIESSSGFSRLRLHEGRLVDAESDDDKGFSALQKVLALREGRAEVRDNAGVGLRSFDIGVAEALISHSPVRVATPETAPLSIGSETPTQRGQPLGRFAQTQRGVISPFRPPSVEPKTLVGFPPARVRQIITDDSANGEAPSAPPPAVSAEPAVASAEEAQPVPAAARMSPPKRFSGSNAPKLSGTGYSSAPPPRLAEERVALPRASLTVAARGAPAVASASRAEADPDTGPVSSLELDSRSLERLEALHEGISSTSHAIPPRDPKVSEEWPPAEPHTSPGGSLVPPSSDRPGLPRVGRYEVLARLKSGGMGSVYLCRLSGSAGFRRLFAMKVLHQDLVHQAEVLELFFREANLLAQLHHPNIVGIVDVGSVEQPYLVLDYVEGGSLQELLRASPNVRHPGVIVAIVLDALNGLSAVHQLADEAGRQVGLMHNDISPHNLLVGVDGTCRVTDFGVAGARREGADRPTTRGKPSFMAPERILDQPCDHRADLFSLGVVLYTALTGVEPFAGGNAEETLENVLSRPILPPSEVGLRPPPCLDWVCMKALARSPAERFQSAEEMASQLRRIVAREDLLVAPSVVAAWVRTVLVGTLEARRAAALKGIGATETHRPSSPPGVLAPGLSMSPAGVLASEAPPPSSSDFLEKTEILSSSPPAAPNDAASRRKKLVLYVALALSVAALVLVFLFPEVTSSFLKRNAEPSRLTSDEAFELLKQEAQSPAPPRGEGEDEDEPAGEDAGQKPALAAPPQEKDETDVEIHLPAIKPREGRR